MTERLRRKGTRLHLVPLIFFTAFTLSTAVFTTAQADCTIDQSASTASCSGDLSAGGILLSEITTTNVSNLTADITPVELTGGVGVLNGQFAQAADNTPGAAGPSGSLSFDDATFGVEVVGAAGLRMVVLGQGGGSGADADPVQAQGSSGQAGGKANAATATVDAPFLKAGEFIAGSQGRAGMAVFVQSLGGIGGRGVAQPAPVTTEETLTGGNGGAGGSGGTASAAVTAPSVTLTNAASAVQVVSSGGDGAPQTASQIVSFGSAFGGAGGNGGAAGSASASLDLDAVSVTDGSGAAILVQSLGGAGGIGTSAGNANSNPTGFIDVGGEGGFGGDGGSAAVNGSVSITAAATAPFDAVRVESKGGVGGAGGRASNSFSAQGGDGGVGGSGGSVAAGSSASAPFHTTIQVTGSNARGFFARSVGATGGAGGVVDASRKEVVGNNGAQLGSGPGGDLSLFLEGSITTAGEASDALIAQSIGGFLGGDTAGEGFSAGIGSAGAGGSVMVNLVTQAPQGSDIAFSTKGLASDGIAAQSIGGGGGKAFEVVSDLTTLGATRFAGGDGGSVQVTLSGSAAIETAETFSRAVYLDSIGNGGGNAGPNMTITALGASGGTGGSGGKISASIAAPIATQGDASDGVFAASRGGGGGSAFSTSGVEMVGGQDGGGGGAGGEVSVEVGGSVSTAGDDADAIFAQSLGGGGGDGASVVSGGILFDQAIGGSGGTGGNAAAVSITQPASASSTTIATAGERSRGAISQSIGGGGGNGGSALAFAAGPISYSHAVGGSGGSGGDGGTANLTMTAPIMTAGKLSDGALVQSVGGGGGIGAAATAVGEGTLTMTHAVGGSGGSGGTSAAVTASSSGAITTKGDLAAGLVAQSIGGGGGHSGVVSSFDGGSLGTFNMTVGGNGGSGQAGGSVQVDATGAIMTSGDSAKGLVAQSVGGGGGNASSSVGSETGFDAGAINVALGGSGGSAGDGAAVTVTAGSITTLGKDATALSALSIGGGGGTASSVVNADVVTIGAVDVAIGRDGGQGGSGDKVAVLAEGAIATSGDLSEGIHAASIGGFGGASGTAVTGAANVNLVTAGSFNVTLGGQGGAGGSAAEVKVTTEGDISTEGRLASGVHAQSIAGGGGRAHGAVTANVVDVGNLSVTVGGDGGEGGNAGEVSLGTAAGTTISTSGPLAPGILAQSIGGAGGSGGFAGEFSVNLGAATDGVSGQVGITVGGGAAAGGTGGAVKITNAAGIGTTDFGSIGLLAQSIGGNGGVGGSVYAGNLNISSKASVNVDVSVGGSGGSGSGAGTLAVTNQGAITTEGFLAAALLAQSVGGNGGNGGSTYTVRTQVGAASSESLQVSVGGNGGSGGAAETVSITNTAAITTKKGGSDGIIGQSIGGGGGRGGSAAYLGIDLTPPVKTDSSSANFSFDVNIGGGGGGGAGADATTVTITNAAPITTSGNRSRGIVAQAIGGGGGDGGAASATSYAVSQVCTLGSGAYICPASDGEEKSVSIGASLQIGGSGGGAGKGGAVVLDNTAAITTAGSVSHGLYAQSVGGGGGSGGDGSLGLEAWTSNQIANNIGNLPDNFLPSFTSADIVIGGTSGAGGDGGAVEVKNQGDLKIMGPDASVVEAYKGLSGGPADVLPFLNGGMGIFAQSVGGGGGDGGAGLSSLTALVTVGNSGSGGGDGGKVSVTNSGAITTEGFSGAGILAQSVGGGGGTAGDVGLGWSNSWEELNIGAGIGIQGDGGAGGDGGAVTVTSSGAIVTNGTAAPGIIAQSVGGSGGMAGVTNSTSISPIFVGSRGGGGNGGDVSVSNTAPITVSGPGSVGIAAHSAGGIESGDSSGTVTVNVNANVTASGNDGRGLLVGSSSFQDQATGDVLITIAEGVSVSTGSQGAETIGIIDGGGSSTLTINGTVTSGNPESFAIRTSSANQLQIGNTGTLVGSVLTESKTVGGSTGFTGFNNSGLFASGKTVTLQGPLSAFQNTGTIAPAGVGTLGSTTISADLIGLGDTGTYALDLDTGTNTADFLSLEVTGASPPQVDGIFQPNLLVTPGDANAGGRVAILDSNQSYSTASVEIQNTATTTYTLTTETSPQTSRPTSFLGYNINTTPWNGSADEQAKVPQAVRARITENHTAFGDYAQALIVEPSDPAAEDFVGDLVAMVLSVEEVDELLDIYDGYAPGEIFAPADAALFSSLRFSEDLNSCPAMGSDGAVAYFGEGSCTWVRTAGIFNNRDDEGLSSGYDETVFSLSLGAQGQIAEGWFLGGAFGYERSSLSSDMTSGDGDRFQGGLVGKYLTGPATLSASVSGGVSSYRLTRDVTTASGPARAEGKPTTSWIGAHARAAYALPLDETSQVEPRFDLGLIQQWQGGFTESGAGDYGLTVDDSAFTYVTLNPAAEAATHFEVAGFTGKASLTGGMLAILGDTERSTEVQLNGLDGRSFLVKDQANQLFGEVGVGLEAEIYDRLILSAGFDGLLSGDQQIYMGNARLSFLF
ncbi:MAG: hypothetical protein RIC87_08240 [Kiloniellales bacterium]